jgi:hypothetical protein
MNRLVLIEELIIVISLLSLSFLRVLSGHHGVRDGKMARPVALQARR